MVGGTRGIPRVDQGQGKRLNAHKEERRRPELSLKQKFVVEGSMSGDGAALRERPAARDRRNSSHRARGEGRACDPFGRASTNHGRGVGLPRFSIASADSPIGTSSSQARGRWTL